MESCSPQKNVTENDLKEYNPLPQISERILIRGNDRRVVWEETPEIIMLRILSSTGESYIGTGTILHSDYHPFCVITAAHNVVQLGQDGPLNVLAIGRVLPDGDITNATGWAYFKNYKTEHDASYGNDLAMVFFPDEPKITSRAKIWLSLEDSSDSWESQLESKMKEIMVVGFPGGVNKGKLMGMKGSGVVFKELIEYKNIDTSAGQSGCPVYYCEKGEIFILGIHYGATSGSNVATILSPRHIKFLKQCFKKSSKIQKPVVKPGNTSPYAQVLPGDKSPQKTIHKMVHSMSHSPPHKHNSHESSFPHNSVSSTKERKDGNMLNTFVQENSKDKSPYLQKVYSRGSTNPTVNTSGNSNQVSDSPLSSIRNPYVFKQAETPKPKKEKKMRIVHVKGMDQNFLLAQKHLDFSTKFKSSVRAAKEAALAGNVTIPKEGFFYVFSQRQGKFNKITVTIEAGKSDNDTSTNQISVLTEKREELICKLKDSISNKDYTSAEKIQKEINGIEEKLARQKVQSSPKRKNINTVTTTTTTTITTKDISDTFSAVTPEQIVKLQQECDQLNKEIEEAAQKTDFDLALELQTALEKKNKQLLLLKNPYLQNSGTIVSGTIVGNTIVPDKVMSHEENQEQLDEKIRLLKEACDKLEKKFNETDWKGNFEAAGELQKELNSKKEKLAAVQDKWTSTKKSYMMKNPS